MARSPEERIDALVKDIDQLTVDLAETIAQMNSLLSVYKTEVEEDVDDAR